MSTAAALAGLADRFDLPPGAAGRLQAVLDLIERDAAAPTTIRSPGDAVDAHVADSLVALEVPGVRDARSVADLGSGAGFPGIALAVAMPEAGVQLVESSERRCRFLRAAIAAAGAANAQVVHARAEEWGEGRGACDLVAARALAALPVVCEYAAPLLGQGGFLVAWRGRRAPDEEADGNAAARLLGLEPVDVRRVEPFPSARDRHLHVFEKVGETPARFPRRAGVARKRPLRATSGNSG